MLPGLFSLFSVLDVLEAVVLWPELALEGVEPSGYVLGGLVEALLHLLEHEARAGQHRVRRAAGLAGLGELLQVQPNQLQLGLHALIEVLVLAQRREQLYGAEALGRVAALELLLCVSFHLLTSEYPSSPPPSASSFETGVGLLSPCLTKSIVANASSTHTLP